MDAEPIALSREAIIACLHAALPDLRGRYEIASLSVFGSRVHGMARPDSDVDVLVEFTRAPGFFRFVELEDELSRLLGLKVDLVMRSALRPRIGRKVIVEALPV